ncbi:MAG: ATP-binding cassette domain-containing protein [Defluviitaleaceae bacterium]|nr:ATP-binding cassette domain-containing protein [Defluviitaleaceae bacterium]
MSLAIKDLTKQFGTLTAVDNLSFEVKKGMVFGLLGRNGAGKSTTIKMILDLHEPTSGVIEWEGTAINQKKLAIGYLPEERGLFVRKHVHEQLYYFGQLEGMNKLELNKAIDYWLERMGVPEYRNKIVSELSKGNQQKIQLIATLLHNPQLIILDEPFTGLDPVNVQIFIDIIKDEATKGKTIIFSSHQMAIVEELCDELILLKKGAAEVRGTIPEIKNAYGYKKLIMNNADSLALVKALEGLSLAFTIDKNTVTVQTENSSIAMDILKKLADAGIVPDEFRVAPPTMQEIFVERIG